MKLQKETESKIQKLGRRIINAQLTLNHLYQKPIIDAYKGNEITKLSLPYVDKLIEGLEKLEILVEITGGKRSNSYVFKKYIEIFKKYQSRYIGSSMQPKKMTIYE